MRFVPEMSRSFLLSVKKGSRKKETVVPYSPFAVSGLQHRAQTTPCSDNTVLRQHRAQGAPWPIFYAVYGRSWAFPPVCKENNRQFREYGIFFASRFESSSLYFCSSRSILVVCSRLVVFFR